MPVLWRMCAWAEEIFLTFRKPAPSSWSVMIDSRTMEFFALETKLKQKSQGFLDLFFFKCPMGSK